MELRPLGRTGVRVSALCLGAFGGWGNEDRSATPRVIDRALDSGINFVDTSDAYGAGESEEIIGRSLAAGKRDRVVLATKFSRPAGPDPNEGGLSRRWILQAVDRSLRRLRTDWIDLYQIHSLDTAVDIDETLGALSDLVLAGKVRYVGTSTFPAHELVAAQWTARLRGRERFVCEQSPYSMIARGAERDVFPVCQEYGIAALAWSPIGGGWLSGRYRRGSEPPRSARIAILPKSYDPDLPANQRKLDAADALAGVAEAAGLTLIQLAIAFVLEHPAISAAIVGPRTPEHLDAYLGALDVHLGTDLLDRIDEIVAPGTNVNPSDPGWDPPAVSDAILRRRTRR